MKKYLKTKEIISYGIGLFGVALLTGWMPDYASTYFKDFAFKGSGLSQDFISGMIANVMLVAGIIGAVAEIVVGFRIDRTKSKWGKIKPWMIIGCVPLAIVSIFVFLAPNISNKTAAFIWMMSVYCLYSILVVCVESPSNCFGSVITPNPKERGDAISVASIFRSVGQSGGMVVLLVVGLIMKKVMGEQGFKTAEGKGLDLQISTVVCAVGFLLFLVVMIFNTKERIPYSKEKVSIKESIRIVFTNKNLLMVALTKIAGFGRGVYGTVSLYIAIYLLGDKGLKIALLLPMGIGTAVGMIGVKALLKKFDTKRTFIICSIYGASILTVLYLVTNAIGFRKELVIPFLIINFFVGLQHGNTNITPNVMIADCVDEIEYKTGKRQEGLCYAGVGLFSKIGSAFTKSFGAFLVFKWSGYMASASENAAYIEQSDATLQKFLIIYTIIPAVFVILQFLPILLYDMTGKKKENIASELIERRQKDTVKADA